MVVLTPKEEEFIAYWKANRQRQKKWLYQLLVGLPVGLILSVLIIVNFSSGWYKRADMIANSSFNPIVLYVAAALIAIFFAVFSKKFQWDQQEQRYRELLCKKQKNSDSSAAETNDNQSNESKEN